MSDYKPSQNLSRCVQVEAVDLDFQAIQNHTVRPEIFITSEGDPAVLEVLDLLDRAAIDCHCRAVRITEALLEYKRTDP